MRVARWSRRNSSSSDVGSASLSSISVMYSSCLVTRFWLRRPRFTKASDRLRRRAAWPAASSTAVLLSASRAVATPATSSMLPTLTFGSSGSSPPVASASRMAWTVAGKDTVARCSAWLANSANGAETARLTRITKSKPRSAPASPSATRAAASVRPWADFVCERLEEMASPATPTRMAKGTANAASNLDLIWRNTVAFLVARLGSCYSLIERFRELDELNSGREVKALSNSLCLAPSLCSVCARNSQKYGLAQARLGDRRRAANLVRKGYGPPEHIGVFSQVDHLTASIGKGGDKRGRAL